MGTPAPIHTHTGTFIQGPWTNMHLCTHTFMGARGTRAQTSQSRLLGTCESIQTQMCLHEPPRGHEHRRPGPGSQGYVLTDTQAQPHVCTWSITLANAPAPGVYKHRHYTHKPGPMGSSVPVHLHTATHVHPRVRPYTHRHKHSGLRPW